ncbi:hypothetical protein OG625_31195 [Streptomyces sp. NBC_01351]|uniref:hypothetical protein n=1 Tax=Streptomyces sp. NBC_01351 TaxID=2903833 RepID=UPI002E3090F1|nr:hypothetical protein [Streptomyces sp. NBC_01351]
MQFGLVVCAVLTPLVPLIVWAVEGILVLAFVTAAVVAVPLCFHARPTWFGRAAGTVAALLVPWAFIGAMAGMFLFFPSALQLLLAAGADPRRRPTAAKVMAGVGLLLSVPVVRQALRS